MTITANAGIVSFGPQAAKGVIPTKYYRHRATMVDLSVVDPVEEGAPEVGGIPVPTFPYKSGPMVQGGMTLQPRLQDTLGWLLYGALGDVVTLQDGTTGMYNHTFKLKAADPSYVPYMGFRKYIPPSDGTTATDFGEIFKDCKIVGFNVTLPNNGPINARVDVLGREFESDLNPSAWTYENGFESWESIPVACATGGFIKFDGAELPVVQAGVNFVNVPLDPRQERLYGDPFIYDVTPVQRRLEFELMVKWANPDLYNKVRTGQALGTSWSSAPTTGSFEAHTVSSVNMTGKSEPWSVKFKSDEAMLSLVGGIQLASNQSIMMRFRGVALDSAHYADVVLKNLVQEYVWPI